MKKLTALLISCFLSGPLCAQEQTLPQPPGQDGFVYFTADKANLDPVSKKVNLEGNVTIVQETKDKKHRVVTGESITLDQANTEISSQGPMTVKSSGATLQGENMSVNYTTKDYRAENVSTEYPPLACNQCRGNILRKRQRNLTRRHPYLL